jgi:hypothetical protein
VSGIKSEGSEEGWVVVFVKGGTGSSFEQRWHVNSNGEAVVLRGGWFMKRYHKQFFRNARASFFFFQLQEGEAVVLTPKTFDYERAGRKFLLKDPRYQDK